MSLTNEEKMEYVKAIKVLWSGTMQFNSVEYMTDEVINLMDHVFEQIREGSKAMVGIDVSFRVFYGALTWKQLASKGATSGAVKICDWIAALQGNRQYRSVANAVALSYKSPVQIALYDAAM